MAMAVRKGGQHVATIDYNDGLIRVVWGQVPPEIVGVLHSSIDPTLYSISSANHENLLRGEPALWPTEPTLLEEYKDGQPVAKLTVWGEYDVYSEQPLSVTTRVLSKEGDLAVYVDSPANAIAANSKRGTYYVRLHGPTASTALENKSKG